MRKHTLLCFLVLGNHTAYLVLTTMLLEKKHACANHLGTQRLSMCWTRGCEGIDYDYDYDYEYAAGISTAKLITVCVRSNQ